MAQVQSSVVLVTIDDYLIRQTAEGAKFVLSSECFPVLIRCHQDSGLEYRYISLLDALHCVPQHMDSHAVGDNKRVSARRLVNPAACGKVNKAVKNLCRSFSGNNRVTSTLVVVLFIQLQVCRPGKYERHILVATGTVNLGELRTSLNRILERIIESMDVDEHRGPCVRALHVDYFPGQFLEKALTLGTRERKIGRDVASGIVYLFTCDAISFPDFDRRHSELDLSITSRLGFSHFAIGVEFEFSVRSVHSCGNIRVVSAFPGHLDALATKIGEVCAGASAMRRHGRRGRPAGLVGPAAGARSAKRSCAPGFIRPAAPLRAPAPRPGSRPRGRPGCAGGRRGCAGSPRPGPWRPSR